MNQDDNPTTRMNAAAKLIGAITGLIAIIIALGNALGLW